MAKKKQWEVGDTVVTTTNTKYEDTGEIVAVRGAGWYSVRLSNTQEIVKMRSSQLQQSVVAEGHTPSTGNPTFESTPGPTLTADAGRSPEFPPPAPFIQDLDALLEESHQAEDAPSNPTEAELVKQVAYHASFDKWVVFTDLHCAPSTLNTTLQVLDSVHQTALDNNAGVLFLGDFWHHRGTLRVDCLNAVLKAFSRWQVPMIMIPGNHDQVTLGGHDHGLTPLGNAYRVGGNKGDDDVAGPLIFSYPTVFRNALFVPHIRDIATMESVLQSKHAQQASALFVHAEVKGALMNDLLISTHGIPPATFPAHKHIYSGHFHKPHIVESQQTVAGKLTTTAIEYLGSPYQVSLSEAEQEKQLVILDQDWRCETRIPLDVGRRHFKVASLDELSQLQLQDEKTDLDCTRSVRKGDRVVVTLPKPNILDKPLESPSMKTCIQNLREAGVMVEVREDTSRFFPTMLPGSVTDLMPENMSPESTWRAYLQDAEMRESLDDDTYKALLGSGLEILQELDEDGTNGKETDQFDLRLSQVTIHGFGPFRGSIVYPLDNRGLVLLRGSNGDVGPDSNGSGKSSLAMAALWALTGSLDARPSMDMKVADVVNDDSKTARVTMEGSINGVAFVISRTKTATRGDLTFLLDGVDMTTQSVKETQALIEEKLGVDSELLLRTVFHGQHDTKGLLDATDAKLKDELSLVVPLDLWQAAAANARAKARNAKKRSDELEGMKQLREGDASLLTKKVGQAKVLKESKEYRMKKAKDKMIKVVGELERLSLNSSSWPNSENIQNDLEAVSKKIHDLSAVYDSKVAERDAQLDPLRKKLDEVSSLVNSIQQQQMMVETQVVKARINFDNARVEVEKLEVKWSLDLSKNLSPEIVPPDLCPTCFQPLASEGMDHDHANIKKRIEEEVAGARLILDTSQALLNSTVVASEDISNALESEKQVQNDLFVEVKRLSEEWEIELQGLQKDIHEERKLQNELTMQLSSLVKESQLAAQKEAVTASFLIEQAAYENAREAVESLDAELDAAANLLKHIELDQEEQEKTRRLLMEVAERCGQRGVQGFVLQNVVDSLQQIAQRYLDLLSEGCQHLELSLEAGEKISRNAFVRGADGDFKQRPLSTLSGGQWRRCSLALSFAFAELLARRGRLKSSLLVLDEPLTHLDRSGRTKFGEAVRQMVSGTLDDTLTFGLDFSTVILILQDLSAEELEEAFDRMDTVVRENGESYVRLDEGSQG
jgi:DNA repair exonuclease SbcCD ATPase subunit/DNA repair exonuclease SbcCD nuclease subunit